MRSISSFMVQAAEGFFVQRKERTGRFSARASEKARFSESCSSLQQGEISRCMTRTVFSPAESSCMKSFSGSRPRRTMPPSSRVSVVKISEVPHQGRP